MNVSEAVLSSSTSSLSSNVTVAGSRGIIGKSNGNGNADGVGAGTGGKHSGIGLIYELPEDVLHALVDNTNPRYHHPTS